MLTDIDPHVVITETEHLPKVKTADVHVTDDCFVVHGDAESKEFRSFAELQDEESLNKEPTFNSPSETVDTSGEAIADDVGATDIILTHYAVVPASAMDATGCSVVTCYATGIDNVDVEAATERGIAITNVPKYCDEEVGEHIVTLALALRRGLPQYETHTEDGGWDWQAADAVHTASTQTLGFFAFGRKARVAASKADAFGFDVVAHDPYLSEEEIRDVKTEPVSFDELVEGSDVRGIRPDQHGAGEVGG